jgi:NAD(P)H-dependent flavin oxidoreductase YrpB (nitropropane dioxygenase family)
MHTPICDELNIEFPIFAFTHCRDVVVAVSKAGGFGVLGAVGFTPEQLEVELNWIDEHIGDHPYGVDIVIPNKYEGMDSNMVGSGAGAVTP